MARRRRPAIWVLGLLALLVALLVLTVVFLTRTRPGVELAGQYVVERLRGAVNGELEVEAVRSAALLRGVTLQGVRITGPDGRLFLAADSARLSYRARTFLTGNIAFHRLTLFQPAVHIERLPGMDQWNFETIFEPDPDPTVDNIVLIEDVSIRDGFVAVRLPWDPDPGEATPDRVILEEVPGGLVRTIRFEGLNGRFPRILWQAPEAEGRVVEIGELSGLAYLWTDPADVRRLRGTVTVRDSVVTFRAPHVRLPGSELSALGTMVLGEKDRTYDIEAQGDDLAFQDFQWLYPPLPREGGGSLRFRVQTRERGNTLWLIQDARLATEGTELVGTFGVVTGDTLYFTNVSLRASPLDLELVQRLLPMELPMEGLIMGTVEVEGPISALQTRGDVRYRHPGADPGTESSVSWAGGLRASPPYSFERLDARVRQLDLADVASSLPGLRVRGVVSGEVSLHGGLENGLDVGGRLTLDHETGPTALQGSGRVAVGPGRSQVDLQLDAEPVVLGLLGEQYPALHRLAGEARGPVRIAGSLEDLRIEGDLATPAGEIRLEGRLALTAPAPGYQATGHVADFRLDRFLDDIPETLVTGNFRLAGSHGPPEKMTADLALDLTGGRIAGVELQEGVLRAGIADGLLQVDTLVLSAATATAALAGSFGLVPGRSGTLEAMVRAESLAPLEPLLFNGAGPQDVAVEAPPLAGTVTARGTLTGSLDAWRADGTARGLDLVYEGMAARTLEVELDAQNGAVAVGVRADSVDAAGRTMPRLRGTVRYAERGGHVMFRGEGLDQQLLDVDGEFRLENGTVSLRLDELGVVSAQGEWKLDTATHARIGRTGLDLDRLVLRQADGEGRFALAGVLPWRQPDVVESLDAAMTLEANALPVREVLKLIQGDTLFDGLLSGSLTLSGTALHPVLAGSASAHSVRYGEAVLDSVAGAITYRDRLLTGNMAGWRGGLLILAADASVPLELALTRREDRLLDLPLRVGIRANGTPAGLLTYFIPDLQNMQGTVDGMVSLVGLERRAPGEPPAPVLEGELVLRQGSAFIDPLNVRFHDVAATATMGNGSLVRIVADLRGEQGTATAQGTLDLARPRDPGFDLRLNARRLDATRRRDVSAIADADVHLGGRFTRPILTGSVRVLAGEMNLDEIIRQHQIVQLDTTLFQLFDATTITYRPRPTSPFLDNLVLSGLTVTADRGFWLRSRELNVEVAGSLDVAFRELAPGQPMDWFDRQIEVVRLTGTMAALRGSYQLQVLERLPARRFEIRSGTIDFPGTPGIDPNLDITAGYRIRRVQGDPLDVVAHLSGTLQSPRVRLSSDSDPPVSETDIASFLLFGRSSLELSQAESDVVASMREGMLGLARPVFLGLAATQLHQAVANLGLPVDYLALSAPEYGFGDYTQVMSVHGGLGVLQGTQLEAGFYAHRDIFVLGTFTPFPRGLGTFSQTDAFFDPRLGARIEWRFRPTWTWEFYWEDRYARTPSFTYDQIHDRPAVGTMLFREWGY